MSVLDANDNKPRFLRDSYEVYVNETVQRGVSLLQVLARDDDEGNNGRIQYNLVTDTPYFYINSANGMIVVKKPLDRETKDRHILEVKATDKPDDVREARSALTTVVIHVTDVNDNDPVFIKPEFTVKVREDMPRGSVITTLVAHDADLPATGGEVNYRVIKDDMPFHIDRNTGVVRLTDTLDFESKKLYMLPIRARDNGTEPRRATADLWVEVMDVNENLYAPEFEELVYSAVVSESAYPGTRVTKVLASDEDEGITDSSVSYSIQRGSGLGRFTVDSRSGMISTATNLDRESQASYWLTVYAQDHGSVPMSSSVEIYIEVKDENDNPPETVQPVYYVQIPENSESGKYVTQITATDKDSESDITYSISGGNTQSLFSIDSLTGEIKTTRRRIDRESTDRHTLEVTISDGGIPIALSSTVQVIVSIEDVNDHAPQWPHQGLHMVSLLRYQDINKPVFRAIALDRDSGDNSNITYSLPQSQDRVLWRIDQITGEIYLKSEASWSTLNNDNSLIRVEATDGGKTPLSSHQDIQFEITEPPPAGKHVPPLTCVNPIKTIQLAETAPVLEFLDTVNTVGGAGIVWYSIVDGADYDGYPMFSIHPVDSLVSVAGKLDFESKREYLLNISATDGFHTVYCALRVQLSNVNEHQPWFSNRVYEVPVRENIPIGSDILTVKATDLDMDTLAYRIITQKSGTALFGMDHKTGVISTLKPLDHETTRTHELIIKVNDNGVREFSDYAKVVIHVEDTNDHAPLFVSDLLADGSSTKQTVRIHEMAVVGSLVKQVQATDRDKGDNSLIQYSLLSGNVGYTFNIDSELGIISLARPLDKEVRSSYELTIMANDLGTPRLSSTTLLEVLVTIADERAPLFDTTSFTAELKENEPIGSFVIALSGESQSTLTYGIENGESEFAVNPNSGIVTSNRVFDYESQYLYNITITATDIRQHKVKLTVIVHILDVNDNRPAFNQVTYIGHVSEGSPDGAVVLTEDSVPLILSAEDKDSNLNALLLYWIVEPEARMYFTIDSNTGAIRTAETADREVVEKFEFSVQVKDQGEESLSAANPATVIITVDDINDSPPMFDYHTLETSLLTPTYQGVTLQTLTAFDPDLNSDLVYEISEGNEDEKFSIDHVTGSVSVSDPKGLKGQYNLRIQVTDGVHETSYLLTITVQETLDSGLIFSQSHYTGLVHENRTKQQIILIVQPLNLDLGEPVKFELLNYRDLFYIGETSGVLETRSGSVLDREVQKSYQVIVRVITGGKTTRLAQVPVNVTVADVNDNAPYFTKDTYYATVMVGANKGSHVTKVTAVDLDEGESGLVRYELEEQTENYFRISKKTGEVTVRRLLTDHANREFTVNVTASDQGEPSLSSYTRLVIKVFTASTPNFTQIVYECNIPENIPLSSAVTTVTAVSPNNNKIIYSIAEGDDLNEFTVQFSTAMEHHGPCTLRVNDDLDYEKTKQYRLKIRAIDVVTSDWSDGIVIINVQDVNDQEPVFDSLDYYTTVSEATTPGTEIISLSASDSDTGINSQIHYKLEPVSGDNSKLHELFQIRENGGVAHVHTVSALDHELYQKIDLVIVATDGGHPRLSSQSYIHVQLTDLNDNAPVFENSSYRVEISDEANKGQFVAMVAALDVDDCNEGELMYNIVHGNDGQAFTINQRSGSVYISPFHQTTDLLDVYMLNVSVSDGIYTSFTSLTIQVNRANRHTPEFKQILYNFKLYENTTVGTVFNSVTAEDEDVGTYGRVSYSLIGDTVMNSFSIHPETGELSLRSPVDRETRDFYMIPVMAQDSGGRTAFTNVYLSVWDVNDNQPQFISSSYSATIVSNSTADTAVLRVSAFDLDDDSLKGGNANLSYSILSTDSEEITTTFSIDSRTGEITLKRDLTPKEDADTTLEFFVRVVDGGEVPLDATSYVTVTFSSVRDVPPVFSSEEISAFVDETVAVGTEVTRVSAVYEGEFSLSYRIRPGSSVRTNNPASFLIDNQGRISTFTALDAEAADEYSVIVEAYTNSEPELVASILVRVAPLDTNDNPPQFTSEQYTVAITEDTPIGSIVLQVHVNHGLVSADDIDQDHSTKIIYSFAPESASYSNLFMIDPNHGYISSLVRLDREVRPTYEFYVQASDEDDRGRLYSRAKVKVDLLDVNDSPPEFPQHEMIGGVRYWNATAAAVSEDAPNGTIVVQVRTTDKDLPVHSTKMYYISGGNDQGHFRIKQTGEVFVSKPLDREQIWEYHLQISATDGVFVTNIMVKVSVLDTNDNAPVCERALYTAVMSEDVATGTLITTIKASDRDEENTVNSRIRYSLEGDGASNFNIDSIRGDISVKQRLDSDVRPVYKLSGVATDGGGLQCVSDIEFQLTDVNDNSPVFDDSVYRHVLPEDAVNNTLLLRVTATDKDSGLARKVYYKLISGGATDMFTIDEYNGIVRLIKPVTREQGESYSVTIAAIDRGTPPRTGTAQLVVQISDVNDPPVFQNGLYEKSVREDKPVGSELLTVRAQSTDTGLNNVIRYRITNTGANNQLFTIHPVTGVLSTAGKFDYELVREYVLNVEARDAGDPPLSDTCMVTVRILDANDNEPTFSQTTYSASVGEDSKIGDHIIQIRAQDLDSGRNADITYSIVSGDDLQQFSIESQTGRISVSAPLDREAISSYRLTIQASDNGETRQMSSVLLIITVTDVNDNIPVFSQTNYTAQVQVYPEGNLYRNTTFLLKTTQTPPISSDSTNYNTAPPTTGSTNEEGQFTSLSPLTFIVTDADTYPNNGPFNYEIISGDTENQFSISEDGQLFAHGTFDMKIRRQFLLQVKVDDGGVPPLSSTTYVHLQVHEATLHPPVIASPRNFTVVAYEGTFPGGVIGHVVARDPDYDQLQYGLVSPNLQRLFSMDRGTGAFSSYSLDPGTYVLRVSVADGRFTVYGEIEVKVISITDDMMRQGVAVHLNGIGAAEFISTLKRGFETAIIGLHNDLRRIHLLSISEESASTSGRGKRQTSQSANGITVLLAAESRSGVMINKEKLASYIRENTDRIESILGGVEISLPVDSFVCPVELSCNSDERCELSYQITQDKVSIHSDQYSFVSLLARPTEKCICSGSTCINPCSSNPCSTHEMCVADPSLQSFSCECPPGTFGEDCVLQSSSPLAFSGDTFARWTLAKDIKTRLNVRLTFRTKQSDAVLMDARGDRDFSTLEVSGGLVQYTFECGSGPASMRTSLRVNDGNWHNVTLERNGNFALLLLDNKYSAQGESDRNTEEINLKDNNVYFGAIVKTLSTGQNVVQAGFKGCMKDIQIDRVSLPYTGSNSAGGGFYFPSNKFECHESFYGECSVNPCLNNGLCLETGTGIFCSCKGFEGSRCEKDINECEMENPCSVGSTCENIKGSYICHCPYGKTGPNCYQNDACLSSPCSEGQICETVLSPQSEDPSLYRCMCDGGSEVCSEGLYGQAMPAMHIVYIAAAGVGLLLLIFVIVIIARCVVVRRRRRHKNKPPNLGTKAEREAMFQASSSRDHEDLYPSRAPSPPPPSVPPRPASYTPSVNEGAVSKKKQYEMSHDYGSAADGLDRIAMASFNPLKSGDVSGRPGPSRTTTSFTGAVPKLTPPPPSISDTDSIRKPAWDFDYPTNETSREIMSGRGSDRNTRGPSAVPSHLVSRSVGSKANSRNGSKPASITNGSFCSIAQEDEGYHWDTSDWVPVREEGAVGGASDVIRSGRGDREDGYHVARLLSMSEVDDSEYVEDSELDDDTIPQISAPSYNVDDTLALQAQYKLDYDLPDLHVPKPNPNHYLPSHHGVSQQRDARPNDLTQPLLLRLVEDNPAVPQRSASLSYSADDLGDPGERVALEPGDGYTSMEADDSQSDTSENICEIESDCETDMEGIISRVKNDIRTDAV